MCGTASMHSSTVLISTRSMASRQSDSVVAPNSPGFGPPELVTRMSRPPKCRTVCSTSLAMSDRRDTSAPMASTSAPVSAWISAAAASSVGMCRAHIATRAPSAASPRAAALPSPRLAAHTSATLPLSPVSMVALRCVECCVS